MLPNCPTTLETDSDYARYLNLNPDMKLEMYRELGLTADEIAQIEELISEELEADTTTALSSEGVQVDNEENQHG